jgi:hypothetical protein
MKNITAVDYNTMRKIAVKYIEDWNDLPERVQNDIIDAMLNVRDTYLMADEQSEKSVYAVGGISTSGKEFAILEEANSIIGLCSYISESYPSYIVKSINRIG